jgi:hypothetical protein
MATWPTSLGQVESPKTQAFSRFSSTMANFPGEPANRPCNLRRPEQGSGFEEGLALGAGLLTPPFWPALGAGLLTPPFWLTEGLPLPA